MIVITYLTPQQNRGSVEPKVAVQYSRPYFFPSQCKRKNSGLAIATRDYAGMGSATRLPRGHCRLGILNQCERTEHYTISVTVATSVHSLSKTVKATEPDHGLKFQVICSVNCQLSTTTYYRPVLYLLSTNGLRISLPRYANVIFVGICTCLCVYFKVRIRLMESEIDSQSGSANTSTEEHVARLVCDAG